MDYKTRACKILEANGNRITQPRREVISILDESQFPLSPYDIAKIGTDKGVHLDTVTVYRIIETLETLGLVHRVLESGKFLKCGHIGLSNTPCHHFVVCKDCGKTVELDSHPTISNVMLPAGFNLIGHRLEFIGQCQECIS
ncbi:transcriptional repressor [bacterium]|nr:transcriptional repressor [bacterium]